MKKNPLSCLATLEKKKYYNKIKFYSLFFPFKRRRLNKVELDVKKILERYNINYPIVLKFKKPHEFNEYAIAHIDSLKYTDYKILIYYNPRFIAAEYQRLVFTGLHEYCHIIYRQKEDFSNKEFQKIFLNIDYLPFIKSIDHLTSKFILEFTPQIPIQNREILKDPLVIEDLFAEGFAKFFFKSQGDLIGDDKKYFDTVIKTHIQIMNEIRHRFFCE